MLAQKVRARLCARDEVIVRHGDAADGLWLVYSGWVKLVRQTPDGKESIIGLCTRGDVFGEAALFPNANYPYQAEAIAGQAELAWIPARDIQSATRQHSAFSAVLMSLLNERNTQTQLRLEHATTMSTAQRLGCFILRLCHDHDAAAARIPIPVEKHVLAAYLGMKPETLSRSQQQLKAIGVEVAGSNVTVASLARLREFVCGSCSESGTGYCDAQGEG